MGGYDVLGFLEPLAGKSLAFFANSLPGGDRRKRVDGLAFPNHFPVQMWSVDSPGVSAESKLLPTKHLFSFSNLDFAQMKIPRK